MPDICDLILDDHEVFRRRFAELDDHRAAAATTEALVAVWTPLAELLDRHAAAEEELLYPRLLTIARDSRDETKDAVRDHNKIRDAVRAASACDVGTDAWWDAVLRARRENSTHMAEEEREPLPDFRRAAAPGEREELGGLWTAYAAAHAGGRDVDSSDKDADDYVARRASRS